MDFSDLLAPSAVALDAPAPTRRAVLERASHLLADVTGRDVAEVTAALLARESLGTTGFGGGVAVPHGRLPGLDGIAAAVVRPAEPVDWQSVDGVPVDLVVALLAPEAAGADQLKALALVSRTLRNPATCEKLRGSGDAAALWAVLTAPDRKAA